MDDFSYDKIDLLYCNTYLGMDKKWFPCDVYIFVNSHIINIYQYDSICTGNFFMQSITILAIIYFIILSVTGIEIRPLSSKRTDHNIIKGSPNININITNKIIHINNQQYSLQSPYQHIY